MQRLRITHPTEYRFGSPVTLMPHRLLLRPREGHDLHIETSKLEIAPAHTIEWHRDVFDNSAAVVGFLEPAARLRIASEVVIQHYEEAPLDFLVEDHAVNYPFLYRVDERADLLPFQQPVYPNDGQALRQWLGEFGFGLDPIETYSMLDRLNRAIANGFAYVVREDEGCY
jgi:transglutaminase-like putative cysteine protease